MKKLFLMVACMFLVFGISSVFALDAPKDLRASSASDTSISLDWWDVEGSVGYYLYYGETTASGGAYEVEGVNLIEQSEFVLKELKPETKYYLAVTSVDNLSTESKFSNELEYMTLKKGSQDTVSSLRIDGVDVIDATSLEMNFSKKISSSAPREFILQEQASWQEIPVSVSEVSSSDEKKIIAVLESELKENMQYKLTVLDIQDTDGGNISTGIDAFTNFTTTQFTQEVPESPEPASSDLNSAGIETPESVEDTGSQEQSQDTTSDTNTSEWQKIITNSTDGTWNVGKTVSKSELSKNTVGAASNNTKLPKTGAEHWVLAFIAILLSAGIYYRNKK